MKNGKRKAGLFLKRITVFAFAFCLVLAAAPLDASAATMRVLGADKLNAAIQRAQPGDTILLTGNINNVTETIVIPGGKNLTIDLNGYTISDRQLPGAGGYIYKDMEALPMISVNNGATLTLKTTPSKGTIVNQSKKGIGITNNGTLILQSGKIQIKNQDGIALENNGTLRMTGGTLQTDAKNDIALKNSGTAAMQGGQIVVQTGDYSRGVQNSGTFTMTGGSVSGKTRECIGIENKGGTLYFTGGNLTVMGSGVCGIYNDNGKLAAMTGVIVCSGMNSQSVIGGNAGTSGGSGTTAPSNDGSILVKPTASAVYVNGTPVTFDAYYIKGNNYFKLRDLAHVLNGTSKQFEVDWDQQNRSVILTSGRAYTPVGGEMAGCGTAAAKAYSSKHDVYLNRVQQNFTAYTINSNNYFKLRDVGRAMNFDVTWNAAANAVYIDTNKSYTAD